MAMIFLRYQNLSGSDSRKFTSFQQSSFSVCLIPFYLFFYSLGRESHIFMLMSSREMLLTVLEAQNSGMVVLSLKEHSELCF